MLRPYNFQPVRDSQHTEEHDNSNSSDSEEEYLDRHDNENRPGNSDWCSCGRCGPMPTVLECVCCKEIGEIRAKMGDYPCITALNSFNNVCLDPEVLWTAMVGMKDILLVGLVQPISNR